MSKSFPAVDTSVDQRSSEPIGARNHARKKERSSMSALMFDSIILIIIMKQFSLLISNGEILPLQLVQQLRSSLVVLVLV